MPLSLRPSTDADVPAIIAIYGHHVTHGNGTFETTPPTEAEMAARISHLNAVSIYDFGEAEDGIVYLAMEFLEGEPLSAILTREGALSLDRAVRITRQAAEALRQACYLQNLHGGKSRL